MARIFVVEDDPFSLALMTYLLEHQGHEVRTARDGSDGLAQVQAGRPPDLVLCDIQMPRMDGFEFARRMRGNGALRAVRLVALTAMAMEGDHARIMAAGFDAYITKPIAPESFSTLLEEYLRPRSVPPAAVPGPAAD